MAAAIDAVGIGADGSEAAGSAAAAELDSTVLSSLAPADVVADSSARSKNAGISETANAAVAIILTFNLIVAS
jgi:hypothetical protein